MMPVHHAIIYCKESVPKSTVYFKVRVHILHSYTTHFIGLAVKVMQENLVEITLQHGRQSFLKSRCAAPQFCDWIVNVTTESGK
ncbi:hypothetical protein GDO81_007323 [Engystomops pustulosus]|uniref:Uncharacterized protein n=1 Tax=Engystomops pustulosus TaxID=76066 RepID=A0AAV7C851_ENGPU|nr:hypothetical protein GDO81_007323 [Engystomops pustulosus]